MRKKRARYNKYIRYKKHKCVELRQVSFHQRNSICKTKNSNNNYQNTYNKKLFHSNRRRRHYQRKRRGKHSKNADQDINCIDNQTTINAVQDTNYADDKTSKSADQDTNYMDNKNSQIILISSLQETQNNRRYYYNKHKSNHHAHIKDVDFKDKKKRNFIKQYSECKIINNTFDNENNAFKQVFGKKPNYHTKDTKTDQNKNHEALKLNSFRKGNFYKNHSESAKNKNMLNHIIEGNIDGLNKRIDTQFKDLKKVRVRKKIFYKKSTENTASNSKCDNIKFNTVTTDNKNNLTRSDMSIQDLKSMDQNRLEKITNNNQELNLKRIQINKAKKSKHFRNKLCKNTPLKVKKEKSTAENLFLESDHLIQDYRKKLEHLSSCQAYVSFCLLLKYVA